MTTYKPQPASDETISRWLKFAETHCPNGDEMCDAFGCSEAREAAARIDELKAQLAQKDKEIEGLKSSCSCFKVTTFDAGIWKEDLTLNPDCLQHAWLYKMKAAEKNATS